MYGMPAPDMSRANWRKSSYSGSNGNCVETAITSSNIAVRDSQNPEGLRLTFRAETWQAFTTGLRRA